MNSWPGCKEGSWPMTQSHLTGHEDINCEVAIPLFILLLFYILDKPLFIYFLIDALLVKIRQLLLLGIPC